MTPNNETRPLRSYFIAVRGFDFEGVYVRADSHSQARYLCAAAYVEAGFGTVLGGLKTIRSVRLCPRADTLELICPTDSKGLLKTPHDPLP